MKNIKDMIDKVKNYEESKGGIGVLRVVDLHYKQENQTIIETQNKFHDSYNIVNRIKDKDKIPFQVNYYNILRGIFFDYEDIRYIIRGMVYDSKMGDGLIYIVKKSDNLEDIKVAEYRIPNQLVKGKSIVFERQSNEVGLSINLKGIK